MCNQPSRLPRLSGQLRCHCRWRWFTNRRQDASGLWLPGQGAKQRQWFCQIVGACIRFPGGKRLRREKMDALETYDCQWLVRAWCQLHDFVWISEAQLGQRPGAQSVACRPLEGFSWKKNVCLRSLFGLSIFCYNGRSLAALRRGRLCWPEGASGVWGFATSSIRWRKTCQPFAG